MEKIASDLKMSRLKQSNIGKTYQSLTMQWKDLDDHYESTQNSLQTRLKELEDREKQLQEKADTFNSQMESKAKKLHGIEKLIQERQQEAEKGENKLLSIQSLTQEYSEELRAKEKLFEEARKLVGDKEKEYDLIQNRFKERTRKLNRVEETLEDMAKEVECKEKEVKRVQRVLDKYSEDVELKKKEFQVRKKEFDLKEEQIKVAQRLIQQCDKEIKLKQEKLSSFEKSIVECSNTLDLKEKMIKELDLKVKDFCLHKKSMVEWSCKPELKAREFEGWVEKLELKEKEKQIESKFEELNLIDKRVNECLNKVQEREKHLDSLEKSVQECSHALEMEERQLEKQARELELKHKQFESIQKSKEKANILASQVKIEHGEHIPSNNAIVPQSANRDGRALQLFMKEHVERYNLVRIQMTALLQGSPDPANLVLDAMQGFYPSNPTVDSRDFELRVIRKSCILLLEELKRTSPQINPLVKEQAMKLAVDWKAKMTVPTEDRLEELGFLWLLAAYELANAYDGKELQRLLSIVPEHATELCRDLGITNKAPASSIICSPIEIETPECSLEKNGETFSSPNLQLISTTDARNLQGFLDEHLSGNHLIQNEPSDNSERSSDLAKNVLDVMQTSFAEYWTKRVVGSKATAMLSYISQLDQLMRLSPHVRPDVKEDAMKLAIQWKAALVAHGENSLEVLGFLHFIATYGLLSSFNGDEIAVLLGRVSQHKQTLEFCQSLCFTDKIPDFIQNLIDRKKLIEAVRLIFTFKLIEKFPPVPLLEAYVEYTNNICREMCRERISLDEKDMVVDYQIAVLRAVIQCIKDYNLESKYPSRDIEIQIAGLENLRKNWRRAAPSIASNVERQEPEKGKKRSSSTFAPEFQSQQQQRNICHREAVWNAGPHPLPTFIPGYLQSRLVHEISGQTGQFAENHGHPRQFGMASYDSEIGPNLGAIQDADQFRFLPSSYRYPKFYRC